MLCNLFHQQATNGLVRTLTDIQVTGSVVTGHFVEANAARGASGERDLTAFMAEVPDDRISGFMVMLDVSNPKPPCSAPARRRPSRRH
jgi:hypothetical protein